MRNIRARKGTRQPRKGEVRCKYCGQVVSVRGLGGHRASNYNCRGKRADQRVKQLAKEGWSPAFKAAQTALISLDIPFRFDWGRIHSGHAPSANHLYTEPWAAIAINRISSLAFVDNWKRFPQHSGRTDGVTLGERYLWLIMQGGEVEKALRTAVSMNRKGAEQLGTQQLRLILEDVEQTFGRERERTQAQGDDR